MLPVILVLVFNVCCVYRMVLLGKRRAHLISDLVGAGPIVIVFSIVVFGCFGLVCACLILLGHAVCCFLRHCNSQTDAGLHHQTPDTKKSGRVKLDLLCWNTMFLKYIGVSVPLCLLLCSVLFSLSVSWFSTSPCWCSLCSTSLPGGNQVDGLPPAPSAVAALRVITI